MIENTWYLENEPFLKHLKLPISIQTLIVRRRVK